MFCSVDVSLIDRPMFKRRQHFLFDLCVSLYCQKPAGWMEEGARGLKDQVTEGTLLAAYYVLKCTVGDDFVST